MRTFGMVILGLGIVLLIMSIFPVANAETGRALLGWLACMALVPLPMIVLGILLIRRAEDRTRAQAAAAETALAEPGTPPTPASTGIPTPAPADPVRGLLARIQMFDLNQLNWVGWLLFFGTLGFLRLIIFVASAFLDMQNWSRGQKRFAGLLMFLLTVGFFVAGQQLLRLLGISIFRRTSEGQTPATPEEKNDPI
ncbi:hypothetical protein [Thermogemmata fonticola]|uniref:Uncharacterized protein n=1 Tax=Thermogemmata fonticola TaxID=2755323 RepID=A0A7V8VFD7_9BACT|nr:hypothetical protein [Thermogemmata fonticola]MBA2226797.1 hypothetical protein [Thermogemmata fonticola]